MHAKRNHQRIEWWRIYEFFSFSYNGCWEQLFPSEFDFCCRWNGLRCRVLCRYFICMPSMLLLLMLLLNTEFHELAKKCQHSIGDESVPTNTRSHIECVYCSHRKMWSTEAEQQQKNGTKKKTHSRRLHTENFFHHQTSSEWLRVLCIFPLLLLLGIRLLTFCVEYFESGKRRNIYVYKRINWCDAVNSRQTCYYHEFASFRPF